MVSFLIVNASPESRITILVGLLRVNKCGVLHGVENEATALQDRQEFQRSQLTELANTDFESWAKESFEIATKIAYRNGGLIGVREMEGRTVRGSSRSRASCGLRC
jgi:hypothetical protein